MAQRRAGKQRYFYAAEIDKRTGSESPPRPFTTKRDRDWWIYYGPDNKERFT